MAQPQLLLEPLEKTEAVGVTLAGGAGSSAPWGSTYGAKALG